MSVLSIGPSLLGPPGIGANKPSPPPRLLEVSQSSTWSVGVDVTPANELWAGQAWSPFHAESCHPWSVYQLLREMVVVCLEPIVCTWARAGLTHISIGIQERKRRGQCQFGRHGDMPFAYGCFSLLFSESLNSESRGSTFSDQPVFFDNPLKRSNPPEIDEKYVRLPWPSPSLVRRIIWR